MFGCFQRQDHHVCETLREWCTFTRKQVKATRGNSYIRLDNIATLESTYSYVMSLTVFTSTLKICRILSFQKAFMQIGATIKLCFAGLSTFVVEFMIVFVAFSAFFYFVLQNYLENFLNFGSTFENTMAMSIGKFNFGALKAANQFAAWIFFAFSREWEKRVIQQHITSRCFYLFDFVPLHKIVFKVFFSSLFLQFWSIQFSCALPVFVWLHLHRI